MAAPVSICFFELEAFSELLSMMALMTNVAGLIVHIVNIGRNLLAGGACLGWRGMFWLEHVLAGGACLGWRGITWGPRSASMDMHT
jgi:hypothetical protein